jgi:hypothetical protein
MNVAGRTYSRFANEFTRNTLSKLLEVAGEPDKYQTVMSELGLRLGEALESSLPSGAKCLIVSTAEDADFLTAGVMQALGSNHDVFAAVFWNNHQQVPGGSVAPIVHKYVQPGFESADTLVIVKSVISGSCVVRTNILALIEKLDVKKICILSPVMHTNSEKSLRAEFPEDVSSKFEFVYFAQDSQREQSGEVVPGIGGEVYQLLGIGKQPVLTGYMPSLVKRLASI